MCALFECPVRGTSCITVSVREKVEIKRQTEAECVCPNMCA